MRSLDPSAERLEGVLDVFGRAGRLLKPGATLRNALDEVTRAVAERSGDYCEITVDAIVEGETIRVAAGVVPAEAERLITEPLSDGRRVLGIMRCAPAAAEEFDEVARRLLQILANELGIALATRMLMLREHRVADRLQRALLPERLPAIDGAVFHAAYRPASDESEVGGDWFDSFPLPDGRVAISVGDVAGHGLDAAVIMGEVRQAIRAAAVGAANSAEVLQYVNRIVILRQSLGIVTAVFGIYDPRSSLLMYASAGHPPPLLALAGGLVKALPSAGLPLGCVDDLGSREWAFTVPPGGHVIFYTDGLVENERDVIAGEKRLLEAVRTIACNGAPNDPALAIQEYVFRGAANRDDAAVLTLSRTARVPNYIFSAVPLVSSLSRAIVDRAMDELDVPGERRFGVLVALGEAIANAIEHAYSGTDPGLLRLEIGGDGNHVALIVEDFGSWRPFVRRAERGRGFEIMHAFMDRVQIQSTRDSTKIVLKAEIA